MSRFARCAVAAGLLALASACAQPLQMGSPPWVEALKDLVFEKSTASEVRAALGEPRGYGRMRHAVDQEIKRVWYYEHRLVHRFKIRLHHILLVFLREDRYEGHFWFAAGRPYREFWEWEIGRRPDTGLLERSLRLGQSTPEDVKALLGEPAGEGGIMMPMIDPGPRKVLSYYYEEGWMSWDRGDMWRSVLLIYFDEGRYDGYMWFSSLPD